MSLLLRVQAVLHRATKSETGTELVVFAYRPEDPTDEQGALRGVSISAEAWADMGYPDRVTVSVQPGDRLNDG